MTVNVKMMGESIRARRKELRITQKELSNITNIAQGYISDIENGNTGNITLQKLIKITEALEIDLTRLFSTAEKSEELYITNQEIKLLEKYRMLSVEQQIKIGGIVEGILMSNTEETDKKGA